MYFSGDLVGQVFSQLQRVEGAVAGSREIDLRRRESSLQIVDDCLDALLQLGRVCRNGNELVIDDERPGAEQKVAFGAINELPVLHARIDDSGSSREQDEHVTRRQIPVVQDIRNDIPVLVLGRLDQVFAGDTNLR